MDEYVSDHRQRDDEDQNCEHLQYHDASAAGATTAAARTIVPVTWVNVFAGWTAEGGQ